MMLVVPSDPLKRSRPDEHFAAEYEAARAKGIDAGLVDHDALVAGDGLTAVAGLGAANDVVYRGWMLSSTGYADLESAASARDVVLRTSADSYRRAHELPGWLAAIAPLTADTVWTDSPSLDDFEAACRRLGSGAAVIRDYVKSEKHYWHEAAFIPDLTDLRAARAVADRLRELRDADFTGGFVLRRFERYVSSEVRTWWIDGGCALITPHPDSPDALPDTFELPSGLAEAMSALRLPFVTADLAQREDGVWRVIEIGDGQVSDRPRTVEPDALLEALSR